MKSVMKSYYDLPGSIQEELMSRLKEGGLERMSFPYKGKLTDGVIFLTDEIRYLVPLNTVAKAKPDPILGATDLDLSWEEEGF